MMLDRKRALSGLIAMTMAVGMGIAERPAIADVLSCPQQSGTVRVWDREVNRCGFLSLANTDWRFIGSPPWNDRIDQFGNDDFVQQRAMCLYQDIQFVGARVILPTGFWVTWNNTVSSNRWTTSSC